jgi:hypothetical protein
VVAQSLARLWPLVRSLYRRRLRSGRAGEGQVLLAIALLP